MYVKLVESVRDNGGTVRIFSSLHVSGERKFEVILRLFKLYLKWWWNNVKTELAQLTGVAALLRFPMPELEDEPLDSDEESD